MLLQQQFEDLQLYTNEIKFCSPSVLSLMN